jgi:serine/threonine protein kinase
MSAFFDWNSLTSWALGYGLEYTTISGFYPSPSFLWAGFTLLWIIITVISIRGNASRSFQSHQYDVSSTNRIILPVFIPLLWDIAVALGCLLLVSVSCDVLLFESNQSFAVYLLVPLNALRFLIKETMTVSVCMFFFQASITRTSLRRAVYRTLWVWSVPYTIVNTALMIRYFYDDSTVPRYIMGTYNLVLAIVMYILVFLMSWGRVAIRPYTWFIVISRSMVGIGLFISASELQLENIQTTTSLIFTLSFLLIYVLGFPIALYGALLVDTYYWRGLGRVSSIQQKPSILRSCLAATCGIGDIGVGLGLRGWGAQQRSAMENSLSASFVSALRDVLLCQCGRRGTKLEDDETGSPPGLYMYEMSSNVGSWASSGAAANETTRLNTHQPLLAGSEDLESLRSASAGSSDSLYRRPRRATRNCCSQRSTNTNARAKGATAGSSAPTSPVSIWVGIVDTLLSPVVWLMRATGRTRRWSWDGEMPPVEGFRVDGAAEDTSKSLLGAHSPGQPSPPKNQGGSITPAATQSLSSSLFNWVSNDDTIPDDPMDELMDFLESHSSTLLDFAYLRLEEAIYHGGLAVIFRGVYQQTQVAVKVFKPMEWNVEDLLVFKKEAQMYSLLKHPHIVDFYGLVVCPPDVGMVTQWVPRGSLRGILDAQVLSWHAEQGTAEDVANEIAKEELRGRDVTNVEANNEKYNLTDINLKNAFYANRGKKAVGKISERQASSLVGWPYIPVKYLPLSNASDYESGSGSDDEDDDSIVIGSQGQPSMSNDRDSDEDSVHGSNKSLHRRRRLRKDQNEEQLLEDLRKMRQAERSGKMRVLYLDDDVFLAAKKASEAFIESAANMSQPSMGGKTLRYLPWSAIASALRTDVIFLGGNPSDVDLCPYDDPSVWPVDDISQGVRCWQFNPEKDTIGIKSRASSKKDLGYSKQQGPPPSQVLDWIQRLRVGMEVARAIAHMHSLSPHPVAHRDIKSLNVLLDTQWRSKVCDFGDAMELKGDSSDVSEDSHFVTSFGATDAPELISTFFSVDHVVGTPNWMAPEVLSGGDSIGRVRTRGISGTKSTKSALMKKRKSSRRLLSLPSSPPGKIPTNMDAGLNDSSAQVEDARTLCLASDVFSLTSFLWELLTGGVPFTPLSKSEIAEVLVIWGARPPIPKAAPRAFAHLLRCGWHPDPALRPTAALIAKVMERFYDEARFGSGSGFRTERNDNRSVSVERKKTKKTAAKLELLRSIGLASAMPQQVGNNKDDEEEEEEDEVSF